MTQIWTAVVFFIVVLWVLHLHPAIQKARGRRMTTVRVTMVAFPLRVTMVAFPLRVTMVAFSPTLGRPPDPVGFSTANATTTITHADRLLSQDQVPLVARRQLSTVDPRRVHMKNLDGGASCTTAMQCTTMQ